MIVNIPNDDSKVTDINRSSVAKVSAVQQITEQQNSPDNGNNLPANMEVSQHNTDLKQTIDTEKLGIAVQQINENEQVKQREIRFSVDEDSGKTVIKVMDLATKEVIRQIPNEEALNFARKLNEGADLTLFSEYI